MIEDHDASALAERIADFKSDPEKMRDVTEFLDKMLELAQQSAELRRESELCKVNKSENEAAEAAAGNALKRRLGRARGFVLRMFDALCNCTQNAATAARTSVRNNPFTKR